ncbi:MAG: serine/threonine protein kinase [Planctomycetota bacterium]|jgi:serine/threonine protein kinase
MGVEPQDRLDRILSDWLRDRAEGKEPPRADVLSAHPELAEGLRARFDALDVFEAGAEDTPIPKNIGKYRIVREMGRGAMGIVYEAEQTDLRRRVALKLLSPVIATDEAAVARFAREAQAAGRLDHPNIAAVHEFGRDKGFTFYTMELIEGTSLHDRINEQRVRPTRDPETFAWIARLFADVAHGLQFAHAMDVVHRDIKPSNILITPDDTPKIVDFGLARIGGTAQTLTSPGEVLGTLSYMSPEQAMAMREDIDARTDVYSLGATLYEALTLRPPIEGEDPVSLISRIITEEPPRPRRLQAEIPKDLETITIRAMAKERERRYPTTHAFAEDLERFLRNEPIEAKPPGPVTRTRLWLVRNPTRAAAVLLSVVLFVAAAGWLWRVVTAPEPLLEIAAEMSVWEFAPPAEAALRAAGVPERAAIRDWSPFLLSGDRVGMLVVTETSGYTAEFDILALGAERELLWCARDAWPDYESTLAPGGARIAGVRSVVTRSGEPVPEESLLLSGNDHGRDWLIVVDPKTGAQRGSWRLSEAYKPEPPDLTLLGAIPDWSEAPRRLLVAHTLWKDGKPTKPCLVVVEPDGTVVRRYTLPALGIAQGDEVCVREVKCIWSPEQPEVAVVTWEGVFVELLVKGRLLDVASARLGLADFLDQEYDKVHGEGAFEKRIEAAGGYFEFLEELKATLKEEEGG